jgi:hypothetical protein
MILLIIKYFWALVAHAYNLSYSGGRNQPAQENSSSRHYLENPFTKIRLVEWLKVKALSSSPSTEKKNQVLILQCNAIATSIKNQNIIYTSKTNYFQKEQNTMMNFQ